MSETNTTQTEPQVLTEIQSGDGLGLAAAGRLFPGHRGSEVVVPSTVFRWRDKGVKTTDGRTVRLEAVRVGSRWLTSRAALNRFVNALTSAAPNSKEPVPETPLTASADEKAARVRRATEKLKASGA